VAPSASGIAQRTGNVKFAAVLAFGYATLRIISCLFLLVWAFGLSKKISPEDVSNQYLNVLVGFTFAGLMIWGGVSAWTNRTTKLLLFTSWALVVVSVILVLATVSPHRVSTPELVRAASAVLSLIFALTIIVSLGTAQEPDSVRHAGWGWSVAGAIVIVLAVVLMAVRSEVIGPSITMFATFQLLVLGILMILIRIWRGATLTLVIVGGLFGMANIVLALFGSFVIEACGYDRTSAYTVWTSIHNARRISEPDCLRNGRSWAPSVSRSSWVRRWRCRCSCGIGGCSGRPAERCR
jgi:hypothetical protein